ncbi:putative T7SS-secreted protein [Streptomyces sp. NPDC102279]|uniref:putative T7SS-secreted protein n=1 Tax=Streptomyces sp. NPDC102279 TaxID=3366153 RepID=UPI0038244C33
MAGRPHDWHPVADSDPVPGDPDRMVALGRQLRKTAEELDRQIRNLKAVADVDAWDSKAGKEFREKAKGNVKKLEAAFKRYDTAATAIGSAVVEVGGGYQDKLHATSRDYASDLNRAQEIADAALKDAQEADERKGAAQRSLDGLPDKGKSKDAADKGKDDKARKDLEDQRDSAGDEIAAAREKVSAARKIRDDAAKRARDSIDAVINHDSLKDGFWDTLVKDIADVTSFIATWCGILSLVVGWIPVIGQAVAGVLGAIAMIATLINFAATFVQVLQGNAEWMDLGFAALGFLMMGVGKGFSKIAGKFAKGALGKLGRAGAARTVRQVSRANKNLRRASGQSSKLGKGDVWKSLKEPFTEPFSKSSWSTNLKALKPGGGNYAKAVNELSTRGGGNAFKGLGKSFSIADPGVASDLKSIKLGTSALGGQFDANSLNKISRTATRLGLVGSGITLGGLGLDSNLDPLLG